MRYYYTGTKSKSKKKILRKIAWLRKRGFRVGIRRKNGFWHLIRVY